MGLAILCPGQGAQHSGMFEMVAHELAAQETLDAASEALGADVRRLSDSPLAQHLFDNAIAQPLICASALATWRTLCARVSAPMLCAGYSIGELAAYGCADSLSPAVMIELAQRRARLMDECDAAAGGMLAVRGLGEVQVQQLCDRFDAEIAIVNGEDQFVIGGPAAGLELLAQHADRSGAKSVRRLQVAIISHTSRLAPAAQAFEALLSKAPARDPSFPVLAGISGAAVDKWPIATGLLASQLKQTIRWRRCIEAAIERGAEVFLELGPGTTLARMMQESYPDVPARSVSDFRSLDGVTRWIESKLS